MMNCEKPYLASKLQLISNVLTTKRYASIAIISGAGLGKQVGTTIIEALI